MIRSLTRALVRPYRRTKPMTKRVAVLIPMRSEPAISDEEMVAVRQLDHFLPNHERFFLTPKGRPFHMEGYGCVECPRKYFGSIGAHSRMLLNPDFYKRFEEYEYLFFYHLDSIVLSPDLEKWMDEDWDYIGPPWVISQDTPWVKRQRVGNCGFSLLRVEAITKALLNRYRAEPSYYWSDKLIRSGARMPRVFRLLRKLGDSLPSAKFFRKTVKRWKKSESQDHNMDLFFSDKASIYNPEFRVAPFEEGLKFGFEADPRKCFELNGHRMPFGAHAWYKFDRQFWEAHLLSTSTHAHDEQSVG
ncbi:MAG: hypothetical protein CMQ49_00465 [Gammaproteobacteria bacterium]|nr:hypothetical protein [Gammaproteobacteria bacterium]|tara:strand:+ start:4404 stop:5309 length:906 start_codon:yes stop_codon:yes gene_type:complete